MSGHIMSAKVYLPRAVAERVVAQVAAEHGVSSEAILGQSQVRRIAYARQEAMYRLRSMRGPDGLPRYSLAQIGYRVAHRDHSTVSHACMRVEARRDLGDNYPQGAVQNLWTPGLPGPADRDCRGASRLAAE